MRVMYVAANPRDEAGLELQSEISDLQERLDQGVGADPIEFRVYGDLRLVDLASTIARVRPDVLHFGAHGDEDALILAHPDGGGAAVDGVSLAAVLRGVAVRPRLIVLNACSSSGMAAELAAGGGADFVIGTDASITNTGARGMAATLYQRLAAGASIGQAFAVAAAHLRAIDEGQVEAVLHPIGREKQADAERLVDPMRIVAFLPVIDDWLDAGLIEPVGRYRPEMPEVRFGLAGAPAAARQTMFFTDDETVTASDGESLADARSWLLEAQPSGSEIWVDDSFVYYGDVAWYAAVTTTDRRIVCAAATTAEALERYYFGERFRPALPSAIAEVVTATIANLRREDGRRRGRSASPRRGVEA